MVRLLKSKFSFHSRSDLSDPLKLNLPSFITVQQRDMIGDAMRKG